MVLFSQGKQNQWHFYLTGLFCMFLLIFPFISLVFETILNLVSGKHEWIQLAWPAGRRLELLARSARFSLITSLVGGVLGIGIGSLIFNWKSRLRHFVKYVVIIYAVVPPYIHALSWQTTIRLLNILLQKLSFPLVPTYGQFVCGWVQLMAFMPFAVGLSILGFERMTPSLVESARVMRKDLYVFFKIVLPLAGSMVAAGSAFMLLISIMDFSIPALFQINTYSLEIFAEYNASYEPAKAFLLSLPLLVLSLLAASFFATSFRNLTLSYDPGREKNEASLNLPPGWIVFQVLCLLVLCLQMIVPVFSLIMATGSLENLIRPLQFSLSEIVTTMLIAFSSAILCLLLAACIVWQMKNVRFLRKLWWPLLVLPITIPAPLVGISLINFWNSGILVAAYRSLLMPILVALIRFFPFVVMLLLAEGMRINKGLFDAASILQKNSWQTLRQIILPLFWRSGFAAACLVFALATGELAATLLVVPPGQSTLTIKIYNYLHYGETSAVAGLTLLMLFLTFLTGSLFLTLLQKKR